VQQQLRGRQFPLNAALSQAAFCRGSAECSQFLAVIAATKAP
jgi:hypothetical protein